MPSVWGQSLGRDFRGRVRFLRSFGRPTRLEPGEQVWLVVDGVDLTGAGRAQRPAAGPLTGWREAARFDVTNRLARAERAGDRSRVAAAGLCRRATPAPRPCRAGRRRDRRSAAGDFSAGCGGLIAARASISSLACGRRAFPAAIAAGCARGDRRRAATRQSPVRPASCTTGLRSWPGSPIRPAFRT